MSNTYTVTDPKTDLHKEKIRLKAMENGLITSPQVFERKMQEKREAVEEQRAYVAKLEQALNNN